jgi:hypothetical protein
MKLYLIGSLRNPQIPLLGNTIRALGFDVFDDWFAGGPEADDYWQKYEETRGRSYQEALPDRYAAHIWEFDKQHLDTADVGVLFLPAGRSGHIELGYLAGQNKPTYVLFDKEPERFDVMYRFATSVFFQVNDLLKCLKELLYVK